MRLGGRLPALSILIVIGAVAWFGGAAWRADRPSPGAPATTHIEDRAALASPMTIADIPPAPAAPDPAAHGPTMVELVVPLSVAQTNGCTARGTTIALLDRVITQESEHVFMEAEDAAVVQFQPDALARKRSGPAGAGVEQVYSRERRDYGPQTGDGASGRYLDYLTRAQWVVNITKPGGYTVWYRYWVPSLGAWVHQDQKGNEANLSVLIQPRKAGEWFWQQAHPSYFPQGLVTLTMTNFVNGPRLDRLALVRQNTGFEPQGVGPPATTARPAATGSVVFRPLRIAGLRQWTRLEMDADLNGGAAAVEASVDGGRTWTPLPQTLAPDAIPASPDTALTIRAQLTRAAADRPGPEIANLRCRVSIDPAAMLSIANQHTRLTFARDDGSLCGIENLATGQAVSPVGVRAPPFRLGVRRPDAELRRQALANPALRYDVPGVTTIPFDDAQLQDIRGTDRAMSARWLVHQVQVTLNVALDDSPLAAWTVDVVNDHPDTDVVQVVSPIVSSLRLGGASSDDRCAWPYAAGELLDHPAALGERILDAGHSGYGFVDLFDRQGGFYLGNHNPTPIISELASRPDPAGDRLELSYSKLDRIRAGGGRATYAYALGPHPGDWHWAADQYRRYFLQAHPPRADALPRWLDDIDAWWITGLGLPIPGAAQRHYDEFRRQRITPLQLGLRYTQIWGSTFNEACPDFYLPRNECGGAQALARNMAAWKAVGGIAGHYIHGNSIGLAYAYADRYFDQPWTEYGRELRAPDAAFHQRFEQFDAPTFRPNYASWPTLQAQFLQRLQHQNWNSPWLPNPTRVLADYHRITWQGGALADFLAQWTDRYVREYHSTTVYYDTMVFAAKPEYNPYLDCNGEGTVVAKRLEYLADITRRMRQVNPDFACLIEGAGDVYGESCYTLLSGFSRNPEILRYTLPHLVVFEGQSNGNWNEDSSFQSLASAFLNGHRLDLSRLFPHARHILRLRQRVSPWLNAGRFMDTLGLQFDAGKVDARLHVTHDDGPAPTRGAIITVRNDRQVADGLVRWRLPAGFRVHAVHAFALGDDRPVQVTWKVDGGIFNVVAPPGRLSAIVVVDEAAGQFAWSALRRQADTDAIALDLYNFATRPILVSAEVRGRDVSFADDRRMLDLDPGQRATATFAATRSSPDPWVEPVRIKLVGDGDERLHLCGLAQPSPNGSFEHNFEPLTTKDAAYEGSRSHFGVPGERHANELFLVPGKAYRVSVAVHGKPRGLIVYYSGDGKVPAGGNHLPIARQDRGWDIYQVAITAGESNALYLYAKDADHVYYYDDVRAEPLPAPMR